jgi:2-aminoadipate transaminase
MTKQAADLHTSSFNQYVAYEVGKGGFLDEHVKVIRATYKERRDVMLEMMDEIFPAKYRGQNRRAACSCGASCLKAWTQRMCSSAPSRRKSLLYRVSLPPQWRRENTMRINFSYSAPDTIREGVTRLGTTLKELIAGTG